MKRLAREDGFALTELLVAMALLGIVLGTSLVVFSAFSNQSRRVDRQSLAQNNARRAIDRMVVQLRSATAGSTTGEQPIEKATADDLVFLAPGRSSSAASDNLRGVVHMRYCLDAGTPANGVLWFQTAPYSTSSPAPPATTTCPGTGWANQQRIADHLVNSFGSPATPVFTTGTDSSGNVIDVRVHAMVDANTTLAPPATDLRSSVTLRNLNRVPTAGLSCQASANGHALCDASSSVDPDGDSLSYSWEMDGNPLAETTYSLDQSPMTSGSTHAFTVTVRDTAGLSSSATQSITMP
jgi:prepilin-type N-terminal cleavage/methylation domain-containing protein